MVLGFLHGSSLLNEERRSGLNGELARWVADGTMTTLPNMVGVNNACHGGEALRRALQARLREDLRGGVQGAAQREVVI